LQVELCDPPHPLAEDVVGEVERLVPHRELGPEVRMDLGRDRFPVVPVDFGAEPDVDHAKKPLLTKSATGAIGAGLNRRAGPRSQASPATV
jgi:hypothetical protein